MWVVETNRFSLMGGGAFRSGPQADKRTTELHRERRNKENLSQTKKAEGLPDNILNTGHSSIPKTFLSFLSL